MNELNVEIAGYNADGICIVCLNFNRKMFFINEVKGCLRMLGNIDVPDGRRIQVCWECLATVRTVSRFRAQVMKSYAVLMDYSKKHRYLESPQALTKHATTRMSCHVVSITSTQWSEDTSRGTEDASLNLDDGRCPVVDDRAQSEDMKVEMEDSFADPLACLDSDAEAAEQSHASSDSDDEVVQLSRILRSGRTKEKSPHRQQSHASADTEALTTTLSDLNSKIANLFQITNQVAASQKRVLRQLAQPTGYCEPQYYREDLDATNKPISPLKQITNAQELAEFEELLSDEQYRRRLVSACSFICSKGYGHGVNCAYRFLDVLFSRAFLCQCSWSGGTRSEGEKVGVKFYGRTIQFFFETILQWDPSYTFEQNETFIKVILKNSKKRSQSKLMRCSSSRRTKRRKVNEGGGSEASGDLNEDSGGRRAKIASVGSKVQANGFEVESV